MIVFLLTGIVINICKCIEFVDDDVDVVTTNTMRLAGDALAFVGSRDGVELATADFVLDIVEMCSHGVDTGRIAHENNIVG